MDRRYDLSNAPTPLTSEPIDNDLIVVRVGELFLKGKNRNHFINLLEKNIRQALIREVKVDKRTLHLTRAQGRYFLRLPGSYDHDRALRALARVFGISSYSHAREVKPNMAAICKSAVSEAMRVSMTPGCRTFKVESRRADKRFLLTSPEISRQVGAAIVEGTSLRVDVHQPDLVIGVEVGIRSTFVFAGRHAGAKGLPVGSSGEVALLLSGGIDSPVAGHLMQKRGCRLRAIHFHTPPHTSERSRDKVEQLVEILARAQEELVLHLVDFSRIQEVIAEQAAPDLRVVLYRRAMVRIAAMIAKKYPAKALVSGDNLGQVASQTLENLSCIEDASPLPLFRPLLTYDKEETIRIARRIASYDVSIQPYDDCCTLFVPKHPATRVSKQCAQNAEKPLKLEKLLCEAAQEAKEIVYPADRLS